LFVGRGCSPLLLWGGGCGPLLFYPQVNNIQSIDVVAYVSVIAIDFAWWWVFGRGPVRSRPVAEAPRILALSLLVCAIHLLHFCDYHRHLSLHTDTSVSIEALLPSCPNRETYAYLVVSSDFRLVPTRCCGGFLDRAKRKSRIGEVLPAPIREGVVFS